MEQILGLVFAVLLSVAASWLDKWWKAHKRAKHRRLSTYSEATHPAPVSRPTPPPMPPVIMSAENEGGSIVQLKPEQVSTPAIPEVPPVPDATAPESSDMENHYSRWRQAIIDAEVLAPRNF